jgi:hypothetical protein
MIASLLWKEWRECRWKILVLFGVYLALVLLTWAIERRALLLEAQFAVMILCLVMPGVIAMGTIADERVRRTAETLQSLPIPAGWVFFIKTLAGLTTLLLPLLAIEAFNALVLAGDREYLLNIENIPSSPFAFVGLSVSLYFWILALAAPRRTELGVAATYVFMFLALGLIALLVALLSFTYEIDFWRTVKALALWSPLGFLYGILEASPANFRVLVTAAIVQLITWPPLCAIALWRYAHTPVMHIARPLDQTTTITTTSLAPRRFPILWKSWRESRLAVLLFSAPILAFIVIDCLATQYAISAGRYYRDTSSFLILPCVLSAFVVILLGTDVGMRESEIHLENFWHSRPIPQSTYFRQRFAFGLLLSLLLLVGPALLSMGILAWQQAVNLPPPQKLLYYNTFFAGLSGPPGTVPPRPVFPDWPPSRNPHVVNYMLSNLFQMYDFLAGFLVLYIPHAILIFSISAFIASLSRRRIIPLMLSFGIALIFPVLFFSGELRPWLVRGWSWNWYASWLLILANWLITLNLSLLFAALATKSTTANWRAKLERRLEPRAEILPAS